jgi:hypothetical protein
LARIVCLEMAGGLDPLVDSGSTELGVALVFEWVLLAFQQLTAAHYRRGVLDAAAKSHTRQGLNLTPCSG